MKRMLAGIAALAAVTLSGTAPANFVRERTFQEKMDEADLVVIATVTAVDREGRRDSAATLSVMRTLKGQNASQILVGTYYIASEVRENCCEVGATYLMFLQLARMPAEPDPPGGIVIPGPVLSPGEYYPVWGGRSLIRIGGPSQDIRAPRPALPRNGRR